MTLKDLQKLFHHNLDPYYGKQEVSSFFVLILEHYFKMTRMYLALHPNQFINNEDQEVFFKVLKALKEQKPIQYILGTTTFCGFTFKLNEHTLIPRPETEELVNWSVKSLENKVLGIKRSKENDRILKILDIGTGSGCIAISIAKKLPHVKVYAMDISLEALKIAKNNANSNSVNINFIHADILKNEVKILEFKALKFDLIISNPPYVRLMEKPQIKANVLNYEPHLALFVKNDNPLVFYNKIREFAEEKLNDKGELFFEINEYLSEETVNLIKDYNFIQVELKKDIFGKYRMVKGQKK